MPGKGRRSIAAIREQLRAQMDVGGTATMPNGETTLARFRGGASATIPRKQFQAIYTIVGEYHDAVRWREELFGWESDIERMDVPDYIMRRWARNIDLGEEEVDEKQLKAMEKKIAARRKAMIWEPVRQAGITVAQLLKMSRDGELQAPKQVQMLYAANAFSYGLREAGAYDRELAKPQQGGNVFNGGKFILNAGAPPPKKLPKKAVINASFREVKDGDG